MNGFIISGGLIVLVIILVLWVIGVYNRLVQLRERVHNGMSQIAAQVESRWDALTNLIQATKNYQNYEGSTLQNVIEARRPLSPTSSVEEVERDNVQFAQALRSINVVAEQYPDLKASNIYEKTMDSVNQYENQVRHSRMVYNDTVTRYNQEIKMFPGNLVANATGFTEENYFKGSEEKAEMPQW